MGVVVESQGFSDTELTADENSGGKVKNEEVLGGRVLVAVSVEASVETKLSPSNREGAVAQGPGTESPSTGNEEVESLDENPNLIGEEAVVG